jgi:hypothetical protein
LKSVVGRKSLVVSRWPLVVGCWPNSTPCHPERSEAPAERSRRTPLLCRSSINADILFHHSPQALSANSGTGQQPTAISQSQRSAHQTASTVGPRQRPTASDQRLLLRSRLHLLCGLEHFINGALHIKGLLRNIVVLAFDNILKALYRICHLHVAPRRAGELLGHVERLR